MTLDLEHTRNQACTLLNSRIDSITNLVKARQRVIDLKTELAEAERDDKRAYVRATKDGWTTDELKKLGLENETATRRRTRTTKTAPATEPVEGTNESADTSPRTAG